MAQVLHRDVTQQRCAVVTQHLSLVVAASGGRVDRDVEHKGASVNSTSPEETHARNYNKKLNILVTSSESDVIGKYASDSVDTSTTASTDYTYVGKHIGGSDSKSIISPHCILTTAYSEPVSLCKVKVGPVISSELGKKLKDWNTERLWK